jgi:hypothetical protein
MTKRLFAVAVSAGLLLFQAVELVRPTDGWYWPFLDYPMYSWPQPKGSVYLDYAFRVQPCEPGGESREIHRDAVGMEYFQFHQLLDQAASVADPWHPRQVAQARGTLSRLVLERIDAGACTGEVWVQRHHMEDGVGHQASEWELARAWSLRSALADSSGGVEPEGP